MTVYKVWIHVERADIARDEYHDVDEPVCLGEFRSIRQARKLVARLAESALPSEIVRYWKESGIYPFHSSG